MLLELPAWGATWMLVISALPFPGFIYYNEHSQRDNDNFYVTNPAAFLGALTGARWAVAHAGASYQELPGEYIVDRWERSRTGVTTAHFRLPDWDSLTDSQSVKYGNIASKRVFRRMEGIGG